MVKKTQPTGSSLHGDFPFSGKLKDSAQQIWLAGLGAFTQAQAEGSKVFDALVKEGTAMQRKTQAMTEEKLSEASHKMNSLASDFSTRANDLQNKATGQWDKLETIFEDRVAKALHRLGVPSAQDVAALSARIDELNQLLKKSTPAPAQKTAAKKSSAKNSP
jgi:poly(hydroxyalkanoate) granule-associated protein